MRRTQRCFPSEGGEKHTQTKDLSARSYLILNLILLIFIHSKQNNLNLYCSESIYRSKMDFF